MGLSCALFAKESMKWCDQDRLTTLMPTRHDLVGLWNDLQAVGIKADDAKVLFTDALGLGETSLSYWLHQAIQFCEAHPENTIFIRTDHTGYEDSEGDSDLRNTHVEWIGLKLTH